MRRLLIVTCSALLTALVVAYGGASWYMAHQVTIAERNALEASPASAGLIVKNITFTPRGDEVNILLRGWLVNRAGSHGTIIIVHGVDSNRADPEVGYLDIADLLSQHGYSSLLFDLRGHGESGGQQVSGGLFEQRDLLGAFDFLIAQGIPEEQIGVLGISLGGAVALLAASKEPRIRAVVADSTFADLSELIVTEAKKRTSLPDQVVPILIPGMIQAAKLSYGIDINKIAPIEAVKTIPYPILLIHGTADERIVPANAHRLAKASPYNDTTLWTVQGANHARTFKTNPQKYIHYVTNYFNRRFSEK